MPVQHFELDFARSLAAVQRSSSDFRPAIVAELKLHIARGWYQVDTRELARKMLEAR